MKRQQRFEICLIFLLTLLFIAYGTALPLKHASPIVISGIFLTALSGIGDKKNFVQTIKHICFGLASLTGFVMVVMGLVAYLKGLPAVSGIHGLAFASYGVLLFAMCAIGSREDKEQVLVKRV